MASRIHSLVPRFAIVFGLVFSVVLVGGYLWKTRPYLLPPETDIFTAVEGRWAWTTKANGCDDDWHRIAFTPDHRVMTITSSEPYELGDGRLDSVAVYDIQEHTQSTLRGAIRGETRQTARGNPVAWDLVMRAPDRYAWHRTDWLKGIYTAEIERCKKVSPADKK
jgi:hypothetical protein